jgi:23S rRNA pseudouridine2605 synthase
MIADGRIAIGGEVLTTPATLLKDLAGVTVDGRPVRPAQASRLYRFYKPQGTITAARDPKGRPTIYDRLPKGLPRLMPVGRLDYTTEGLLLLTNDGELKRRLELPSSSVVRRYRARAFGRVSQDELDRLAEGITIEGIHYGPIIANLERRTGGNCWIELSLTEGKNREVRRVLAHLGLQVSRLIRTAYGPFDLAGLPPGLVEEVPRAELDTFRASLK